jgi:hypothetical protein
MLSEMLPATSAMESVIESWNLGAGRHERIHVGPREAATRNMQQSDKGHDVVVGLTP